MKNLETKLLLVVILLLGIIVYNLMNINSQLKLLPKSGQIDRASRDISGSLYNIDNSLGNIEAGINNIETNTNYLK